MKRVAAFLSLATLITALVIPSTAWAQTPTPNRAGPWNYGTNNTWSPDWNRRPNPHRGACFYSGTAFTGNHFCVVAGDKLPSLPGGFGDNISSIRTFGGANARIFNDRNFTGGSTTIATSTQNLRSVPFRDGHTWNNRISSVMVH